MESATKHHLLCVVFIAVGLSILPMVEGTAPAEWLVKDSNGYLCMKMKMAATITVPDEVYGPDIIEVPAESDTTYSKCRGTHASFTLTFVYDLKAWGIRLDYTMYGLQYKLDRITIGDSDDYSQDPTADSTSVLTSSDFPNIDVGYYYSCDDLTFQVSDKTLTLKNVKLQPYVQYTSDVDYGKLQVCESGPSGIDQIGISTIIVVAVVTITPIIMGIIFAIRLYRKKNNPFNYQVSRTI